MKELVRPYLKNSIWVVIEHFLKIVTSICSIGLIARHYSMSEFGFICYGLAIVSIATPIARLGLESVLVVQISRDLHQSPKLLNNAFWMILINSILLITLLVSAFSFLEEDPSKRQIIILLITSISFIAFMVFDSYFQAIVHYKYTSIAKSCALLIGLAVKFALVMLDAGILWIGLSFVLDSMLIAILLSIFYFRKDGALSQFNPATLEQSTCIAMLSQSWPMIVSGLSGMLLSKIDQVMIDYYLGPADLGIYAAGARIYEGWISLTFMYSVAALPLLTKISSRPLQDSLRHLSILFAIPMLASIVFCCGLFFLSELILSTIYGATYAAGAISLKIQGISAIFASLGYMSARYLIATGKQKSIASRNMIAILMNVTLNVFLIPAFGIAGAAVSTLASQFFAHFVLDYFNPDLGPLKKIKQNIFLLNFLKQAG